MSGFKSTLALASPSPSPFVDVVIAAVDDVAVVDVAVVNVVEEDGEVSFGSEAAVFLRVCFVLIVLVVRCERAS